MINGAGLYYGLNLFGDQHDLFSSNAYLVFLAVPWPQNLCLRLAHSQQRPATVLWMLSTDFGLMKVYGL